MVMRCLPFVVGAILVVWLSGGQEAMSATATGGDQDRASQLAQATSEIVEWQPSLSEVREMQLRLREFGFDPGAPDGILGPQTRAMIRAYQQSLDIDADGIPTRDLYERLTGERREATQEEAIEHPTDEHRGTAQEANAQPPGERLEAEPEPEPVACVSPVWEFEDAHGSRFTLTLRDDGSVEGPSYPRHWRWQPVHEGMVITYDNGMGLAVTRRGRLDGVSRMTGDAQDSRGRSWGWQAERLDAASGARDAVC